MCKFDKIEIDTWNFTREAVHLSINRMPGLVILPSSPSTQSESAANSRANFTICFFIFIVIIFLQILEFGRPDLD